MSFARVIEENPVIAAVRTNALDKVLTAPVGAVIWLDADIMTAPSVIDRLQKAGKQVLVHLDLAAGIGKDKAGVAYLNALGADGIVSTKTAVIQAAKACGLVAVQRFFALDTQGVRAIEGMVQSSRPDYVEVMPAVALKAVRTVAALGVKVIAGGLLEEKSEVLAALSAGAVAVSTGKADLWYQA